MPAISSGMRQSHVCPKCRYNRILSIQAVPDSDGQYGDKPMHAVLAYNGPAFFGGDKTKPVGVLSSCICRRCGYTELYTVGFEHIPVDGRYVAELVGPEPEAPYR